MQKKKQNTRCRHADPAWPGAVQASVKLAEVWETQAVTCCWALIALIKVQEQLKGARDHGEGV